MSPAQKEAYEESKLKMRRAIADPALVDESEQVRKHTTEVDPTCKVSQEVTIACFR